LQILQTNLKQILTKENTTGTIDLGKPETKENSVQVLSIGQLGRKYSFILETKDNYQNITLNPTKNLERINSLPIESITPVEVVSKSRRRKPRLKEQTFLKLLNGGRT
jgi:hypothetical protein